jgi:hypothetical protein
MVQPLFVSCRSHSHRAARPRSAVSHAISRVEIQTLTSVPKQRPKSPHVRSLQRCLTQV